ncbi:hypothetical protein N0V90_003973 [Kalmusia sp. IMI 367209]|nr:hypothetical protein N0V90_003973 [Kalmusia sp. IMI 367209]
MATPSDDPSTARAPQPTSSPSPPTSGHDALSSSPVEMKSLPASASEPAAASSTPAHTTDTPVSTSKDTQIPPAQEALPQESIEPATAAKLAPPADLNRSETEAIGPSTDTPAANPDTSNGPVVVIMLLLTTGARHPYKIDERYLKKRNVTVDDMDPYNISVYTLKELIWRDWREDCRFQTEAPNVVHMTIKPQEIVDEEDAKTGKGGKARDGDEETHAGCRCVIL